MLEQTTEGSDPNLQAFIDFLSTIPTLDANDFDNNKHTLIEAAMSLIVNHETTELFNFVLDNLNPQKSLALLLTLVSESELESIIQTYQTEPLLQQAARQLITSPKFDQTKPESLKLIFEALLPKAKVSDILSKFLNLKLDAATQQAIQSSPVIQVCQNLFDQLRVITITSPSGRVSSDPTAIQTLRRRQVDHLILHTLTTCSASTTRVLFSAFSPSRLISVCGSSLFAKLKPQLKGLFHQHILPLLFQTTTPLVQELPLLTDLTPPINDIPKDILKDILKAAISSYQATKDTNKQTTLPHFQTPTSSDTSIHDLAQLLLTIKASDATLFKDLVTDTLDPTPELDFRDTAPTTTTTSTSSSTQPQSILEFLRAELSSTVQTLESNPSGSTIDTGTAVLLLLDHELGQINSEKVEHSLTASSIPHQQDSTKPGELQPVSIRKVLDIFRKIRTNVSSTSATESSKPKSVSSQSKANTPATPGTSDDSKQLEDLLEELSPEQIARIEESVFYKYPTLLNSNIQALDNRLSTVSNDELLSSANSEETTIQRLFKRLQDLAQDQSRKSPLTNSGAFLADPLIDALLDPAIITLILSAFFEEITPKEDH